MDPVWLCRTMTSGYVPSMGDAAVQRRTGRDWASWFALLDAWGARRAGHAATARWLQDAHEVDGWWAQSITVEYERSRGLRKVGQRGSGDFEVTAQRTLPLELDMLVACFVDGRRRRRWLEDAALQAALTEGMRDRRETDGGAAFDKVVRCPLPLEGATGRLELSFSAKPDKIVVRLQHTGIPDQAQRDRLKARWSAQLDRLRALS